jgi:hypothetical protein
MVENEHVRRDFRGILDRQSDVGDAKIISTWFLEPPNIFDPKPKKSMKLSLILGLTYLALMAAACTAFNLR